MQTNPKPSYHFPKLLLALVAAGFYVACMYFMYNKGFNVWREVTLAVLFGILFTFYADVRSLLQTRLGKTKSN